MPPQADIPVSEDVGDGGPMSESSGPEAGRDARRRPRWRRLRRVALAGGALALVGLVVLALSRLNLHSVGHTLASASPGWVTAALALMGSSLVLRAISWHQTLRAALPDATIAWMPVVRATIVGVMASALVPGRVGEPSRSLMVSRRLGATRRFFPIVLGTVFSQALINLLALTILAVISFSRVPLFHGKEGGLVAAVVVPLAIVALVMGAPRLLRLVERSRVERLRLGASWVGRQIALARRGLRVFARPRYGIPAVAFQLGAWALQWLSCYAVLRALSLTPKASLVTAAAILLAVNVSAILPATPSNVGVFQAACLVVLAAFGFSAGVGVAYGIMLQAVEVVTAVAMGIPALLGEGISWREISRLRDLERAPD
jgi:phosphatidylinositol alpha-mannosyltransferase